MFIQGTLKVAFTRMQAQKVNQRGSERIFTATDTYSALPD